MYIGPIFRPLFPSKLVTNVPVKQSILEAIEHLLARYREMRPLFLAPALPINVEWNMYIGPIFRFQRCLCRHLLFSYYE
jgi:hypothetical protein